MILTNLLCTSQQSCISSNLYYHYYQNRMTYTIVDSVTELMKRRSGITIVSFQHAYTILLENIPSYKRLVKSCDFDLCTHQWMLHFIHSMPYSPSIACTSLLWP